MKLRSRQKGAIKVCAMCGEEFYVSRSHLFNPRRGKFCSQKCSNRAPKNRKKLPRETVACGQCGKEFQVLPSRFKHGAGRLCSVSCREKSFREGANKLFATAEWKQKCRDRIKVLHDAATADETQHPRWKGDDAGYYAVHDWMTKHFGQPTECEQCGLNDPLRKYHWANLSGEYRRDRNDFKRMCVSCHRKYDYAAARKNSQLATTR